MNVVYLLRLYFAVIFLLLHLTRAVFLGPSFLRATNFSLKALGLWKCAHEHADLVTANVPIQSFTPAGQSPMLMSLFDLDLSKVLVLSAILEADHSEETAVNQFSHFKVGYVSLKRSDCRIQSSVYVYSAWLIGGCFALCFLSDKTKHFALEDCPLFLSNLPRNLESNMVPHHW